MIRLRPGLSALLLLASLLIRLAAAGSAGAAETAPGLNALDLRVCDVTSPVGVDARPWFGWLPLDVNRASGQARYRIQVASTRALLEAGRPDMWESGSVASSQVGAIPYAGAPLRPDTRYYWRATLVDDRGQMGPPSAVAMFDVGPLTAADWSGAAWIRRESDDANDYTYYRHRFDLPAGEIARAVLHLSAAHKYEVALNGITIGKGPAYHQPQYHYYNGYDVAGALRAGAPNAIAVFARWWGAGQGRPKAAPGLIARLTVDYADGHRVIVGTDGTWKQRRAAQWEADTPKRNRTNGVGFIEKIHADRILAGWQAVDFDDSDWDAAAILGAHPVAPWTGELQPDLTRVIEQAVGPVTWTRLGEGHWLADFGKVRAGCPEIDFPAGGAGTEVVMTGGYTLEADGRVSRATTQKTDLSYRFTLSGEPAQFRAAEYLGMRYLEIEHAPAALERDHVRFIARHYELQPRPGRPHATFASSNAALDRAWHLMVDSIPVCTQEQFIDTPTREKGGFLGDAWSESVAAMIALGDRTMTRRVLLEYLDSQDAFWSEEGALNDVYPYDHKEDIPDYTQMYLLWVWDNYLETGDRAFLADNYDRLARIAAYVRRSRRAETGLIHDLAGGKGEYLHGIIDWPKSMRYGYDMQTSARTVINAYACADFEIMTRISRVLGRADEAGAYAHDAASLRDAINTRLVLPDGRYSDGLKADGTLSPHASQQANMLPLAFGLVPGARQAAVLDHIKALRMSSGLVTVRMLVEAIGECGDGDHLVELFTNPEWHGWANILSRGATCTWESWTALEEGHSLSHAWGAIGLVGHVRYVLGLAPIEPQHARVRVRPLHFGASLTRAEGTVPTDRGTVRVAWRREAEHHVRLEVEFPDTMTGEVWTPASADARLYRDGHAVEARREGAYLVSEAGPGAHVFETR
ncbi:MAG: family 78 glycoside hydrolase catalytic domain [Opitutaceae bacterium]|nr:family 78 glycoside hydrolase catalytic domain [Opitutaceae bacterium]